MFNTLKRLLVGRPLATSEQEHQRISKTIALAVFSSDAISSTAYATQEILFVVAVGGSSLALGLSKLVPISIAVVGAARDRRHVVPPDDLRVPERRRFVRREPREPRREPGAGRGRVAARRLHPHGRGVGVGRRRARSSSIPQFDGLDEAPRRAVPRDHPAHHAREPARHQGVGPHLRVPDVPYIFIAHRAGVPRAHGARVRLVRLHPRRSRSTTHEGVSHGAEASPAARSACSSCCAASRRARSRSPVSRRSRTAFPRSSGRSRRTRRSRSSGWRRSSARCSSACRSSRTTCSPYPEQTRSRCSPQMGKQVFGNNFVFCFLQLRDRGDPHARGEHRVRRLPAALVDHRPRRLPAAPAREPRRPAGVPQRRARARGRGGVLDRDLRRQRAER